MIRSASMRWLVVLGIGFAQVSTSSADDFRWGQYSHETDPAQRPRNRAYLEGAIEALVAYNDQVPGPSRGHKPGQPLFCLPSRFPLTIEQADTIMRRWAAKQTLNMDVIPVAVVLMGGLMDSFPCQ